MEFGQFLRERRKQAGLSQHAVALALGFAHRANVSKLEGGKLEISLNSLLRFAELTGIPASNLLAEYEAKNGR